jgi:hypothetical protein
MPDSVFMSATAALSVVLTRAATVSPSSPESSLRRRFTEYNQISQSLNADTNPDVTQVVDLSKTLSGTTYDFDLTAAPSAEDIGDTIDLTGLKLVGLLVNTTYNNNAAGITLGPHPTTNAYSWCGTGIIPRFWPGCSILLFFPPNDSLTLSMPAVDATHKVLRFAGTAADDIECLACFGT